MYAIRSYYASYCFSQSYKSQNDIEDSIQYYSEQLTGKWELVAIYNNELFIETTLYTGPLAPGGGPGTGTFRPPRITSYNVCYTKLLRAGNSRLPGYIR